ncbi:MAG TPA: Gfo/Idh/MocA family oxidoreductase, partial [Phycisphaerales bacterium]|nr:Gfo/Idh/MocA family oxidoreductase [Phycisphaerales bacterium]
DRDERRRAGIEDTAVNLDAPPPGLRTVEDPDNPLRGYETHEELLADPAVDAVCICTPTDTHARLAIAALNAGKHVLVEKPVALEEPTILEVEHAAVRSGRVCVPAMCMRFWPGWDWLIRAVRERPYGRVISASFSRIGSRPTWSPDFYLDPGRSGGALFDLHIHDVDFIHHLFGSPRSVFASGNEFGVTTVYDYPAGPDDPVRVTATGAWLTSPGFPFHMRYLVEFERATADFDIARSPALRISCVDEQNAVEIPPGDGYAPQAGAFIDAITGLRRHDVTLTQAAQVTRTITAERASMKTRRIVTL